jgi:trimethylamine--corrinoid protein Co-methyltransferase
VRIGREIVEAALRSAPEALTLCPRNPARAVRLGRDELVTATVLGPPYCTDIERGRRTGNLADHNDLLRLAQYFNAIHLIGGAPCEAIDVAIPIRHLDTTLAQLELTDKVPYVFCHNRQRIHDALEMIAIARGMTREQLPADTSASTYSIINTNSPLQYDTPMAMGVIELARHGQPTLITPFSLAGATMPVTLAGAIALSNAEMLAGLTLAQLVRPGAPILTGAKTISVDMHTGAPAFGWPEFAKALVIGGQLAKRYRIPYRASNQCSSNAADAQSMYESQMAMWPAMLGGVNLLMHAAGWLEGGLCAGFEKFVLDVEMVQMMAAFLDPVPVSVKTLALEEIEEVGPGGFYFGTPHTIAEYRSAFYHPMISTTQNHGAWLEAGAKDATRRAHEIWKQVLREYEAPPMDEAIREELRAFVARRKAEGGAPLD